MQSIDYSTFPKRHILCVDMKSFYASCAAIKKGLDPLTTYLAVVSDVKRKGSVVLAASPALKRDYNIRTGSRLFEIPSYEKIVIVPAEMQLYLKISIEITRLFNKYVPKESIHTYSVDESFLEVDGTKNLWGSPQQLATLIIEELLDTFGLTASIGIGPNMLLAKLCLDLEAKCTGIAQWTYDDVPRKLWPIAPLSKMWGIGRPLESRLNRMGIATVGDLAHYPLKRLEKEFGIIGNQLYFHAHGVDLSDLGPMILQQQKSYGHSQILLRDYHHLEEIKIVILEMCEEVARRARTDQKVGRTVSLGIGYSDHDGGGGFYRSFSLDYYTNLTMEIYEACLHLFYKFYRHKTVRKISINLSHLKDETGLQLSAFSYDRLKKKKLHRTMDQIRKQYGSKALLRAVSYTKAGTTRQRQRLIGGHYA